ncbi:MAG: kelch repeat-containing protein [Elusimicrobiota bacterium]
MRRLSTALAAAFISAALPSVSSAADLRVAHTSTLLPSGDILIAGGIDETGATLQTADLFEASLGNSLVAANSMSVVRASHTATLLSNGCVLAVGGNAAASDAVAPSASASAEIYNTATGLWVGAPSLTTARYNHTATLLNSGVVLICGGQDSSGNALASCEFYTPTSCTTGSFGTPLNLLQGRYNHTATLLKDGKVWFAGGINPSLTPPAERAYLSTTERYNPASNAFQSAPPLIEARAYHTATMMGDGKVLVVGGYNSRDVLANVGITESAEIYDPVSNTVSPAAVMSARRQSHATVLGAGGEVTVFGGLGNITTTYLGTALNTTGNLFVSPSNVNSAAGTLITGGSALIDLDFLLNKPVFGRISNGEMWLSSPAVHTEWGMINFVPASETNPLVGLRINLAGAPVGCRSDGPCGNVRVTQATLLQMSGGQIVFWDRIGLALGDNAIVTAANMTFNPSPINTSNLQATVTAGTLATSLTIPVDKAFIGYTLVSGALTITDATLTQASSWTVTMTGGTANLAAGLTVTQASNGDGQIVVPVASPVSFSGITGSILFTGSEPSTNYNSGVALALSAPTLAMTANLVYTMSGADLTGEALTVDVSTVIIRSMLFADGETYKPNSNSWTLAPPPGILIAGHRYGHSAVLLPNNDKVFIGGRACGDALCATQVATSSLGFQLLYSEKNFAATSGATAQRAFHTATLLPGGDILVAGGTNGPSVLSSAELFTPETESFTPTLGNMIHVRDLHTATLLPNGRVLLAGGFTTNATSTGSTNTAEIYYPDTKLFIETSSMTISRSNHSATMLPDGRVFVAGGFGAGDVITGTSEIFISTQHRWIQAATMPSNCERALHATVQLKNGKILLIGGVNASGPLDTTAVYDPTLNTWDCATTALIGAPGTTTRLRSHTATLLFNGRVLVAGGNDGFGEADKSYLYDPNANTWTQTHSLPLFESRFNHTATLLPNGNVMISGGSQRFGNVPQSIEIFHVNASSWVTGGVSFAGGERAFHTMTLAMDNKMYGIGGSDGVIGGSGVSLYTSAEAGYFSATPDASSKGAPPSIRQATISGTFQGAVSTTVFMPTDYMTVSGSRFRGGTEASGGGAASANSVFSYPRMVLMQVEGSGGAATQSNGGFAIDLTPQIFQNASNLATLDTSLSVLLPLTSAALPYGWYTLRVGANDIYSTATLVQVGPPKPVKAPSVIAGITGVALGMSSMTWTWDAILETVDGYNVYDAVTDVFLSTVAAVASPSYIQTGLSPNSATSIRVAAYTLLGDGPSTTSSIFYTGALIIPVVTQPIVNGRTTTSIDWAWVDPGDSTFQIYNATNNVLLGTSVVPSFTEVNLGTNTQHSIIVRATNSNGAGPLSPSATTYTAAASPTVLPIGDMDVTTGSFVLKWTNNGNPPYTDYEITATEFNNDGTTLRTLTSSTTGFIMTFGDFTPCGRLSYAIHATNADDTADSAIISNSTWTLPNAPYPLTARGTTPTSITVDWSANNNSSSATYQVNWTRNDDFSTDFSTVIAFSDKFGGTTATVNGLITSATYSVRAVARNPFGWTSQFSNTVTTLTYNGGAPVGSIQGLMSYDSDSTLLGWLGNNRLVQIRAPAQTFPSDVTVTVSSFLPTGTLCPNATDIAFSIIASPALQPIGSLYLTFDFAAAELGTIPASRALLLRYDPGSNTCVPLETIVDTANGKMTARINHLSLFQVGQVPLTNTVGTARLFPNPFYTARDGFLTIDNIPPGARVRIFTLRGEQVLDVKANSTGLLTWSATNGSGRSVASGVYLVMVESGGTKKILKLAVIR